MFANSNKESHAVHMAMQYTYPSTSFNAPDETLRMAFRYASFPTLGDMVTYGDTFPTDKPQCLFEMTREGTINAPFMDVDCTLGGPAPQLLMMIVSELMTFTQKHLEMTPRVVCTDSSRDKGCGSYKNSWHIILHDIGGFRNGPTEHSKGGDMRRYFELFFASLQIPELRALDKETWDVSVYSKNSNMRCVGSHKVDDESRTRMKPHERYKSDQLSDYYVQQPALDLITLPPKFDWPVSAPGKKAVKSRPEQPEITVSTSTVYSSERNEKRTVAQCIEAVQSGNDHWQESFNDPHRLVKLYFDVDLTLKDGQFDQMNSDELKGTFDKYRTEYPDLICNWLCADHSHNLELSHDDIAISDSSGLKDDNYHLSFHAVIQGYCCKFGEIKAVLLDHGLWDAKTDALTLAEADCGVYDRNHMFRMIGCKKQTKGGATDERVLTAVTHTDEIGAHIVQNVTDEQVLKPSKESILSTKTTKSADVDDEIRDYLEANNMTIVSCQELPLDPFSSDKPAKTINVKGLCPFAKRHHKNNHCYVIVNDTDAYIKCHDDECRGLSEKLDWVPRKQAEPMEVDDNEDDKEMDRDSQQAISDLIVWKMSHPSYKLNELRQAACDDMSVPLGFTFIGTRGGEINGRVVPVAEFMSTVKLCPNHTLGLVANTPLDKLTHETMNDTVCCDGRLIITLLKDMPHVMYFRCQCCSQDVSCVRMTDENSGTIDEIVTSDDSEVPYDHTAPATEDTTGMSEKDRKVA